jgi:hypothetical protein
VWRAFVCGATFGLLLLDWLHISVMFRAGQNIYGVYTVFVREITKYTVIYGVCKRLFPNPDHVPQPNMSIIQQQCSFLLSWDAFAFAVLLCNLLCNLLRSAALIPEVLAVLLIAEQGRMCTCSAALQSALQSALQCCFHT